jgi:hypothetical protein
MVAQMGADQINQLQLQPSCKHPDHGHKPLARKFSIIAYLSS